MKNLVLKSIFFLITLIFVSSGIFAQDIPEEAQKHLAREKAAVEIAKAPEDYKPAITEFKQAIQIAPTWGEPHYQLGLTYEKMEKYADAIASLKKYVELAPDAENVSEVKSLIYKLEYKAEQVPTVSDIIDILVDLRGWEITGEHLWFLPPKWMGFEKAGENSVKVLRRHLYYKPVIEEWQTLEIKGPKLVFFYNYDNSGDGENLSSSQI